MMFRSVQAEDESGSDWDEPTPNTTPRRDTTSQSPTNRYAPTTTVQAPQHQGQPTFTPPAYEAYETVHEPHPPSTSHELHTLHSPHPPPTSHSLHTRHRPQHYTTVQIETHDESTPQRHQHTSTQQAAHPPQDTHQLTHEESLRPPRILPPIEQSVPAKMVTPPRLRPLTPASINLVYEGEPMTTANSATDTRYDETIRLLPLQSSELLEFASVNGECAQKILPSYGSPPYSHMGDIAEKSDKLSRRCTEEVVSCMKIVSDFIINFILGLIHFFLYHVVRKLLCGVVRIVSDTCFKSSIDVIFNGILWPLCAMGYQISKAGVLILTPIVGLVGTLLHHVANMLRACRLVELHFNNTATRPINV